MANHIFSNENRNEGLAIVDIESMSNKIWCYRAAAGPGLDRLFAARFVHLVDLVEEFPLDVWAFFK